MIDGFNRVRWLIRGGEGDARSIDEDGECKLVEGLWLLVYWSFVVGVNALYIITRSIQSVSRVTRAILQLWSDLLSLIPRV